MAYAGDFIAFLKEALNMRAAHATYRTLAHYVEAADAAYGGEDPTIDQDFRSGVNLGNGMISLILSLLPSTVLKIVEVFGFSGDREAALRMLMKPGGWKAGAETPAITEAEQGIRRPSTCSLSFSCHRHEADLSREAEADSITSPSCGSSSPDVPPSHRKLSPVSPTVQRYLTKLELTTRSLRRVGGVDIATASVILHYNLDKYPNGCVRELATAHPPYTRLTSCS